MPDRRMELAERLAELDAMIPPMLRAARVPGAAIAVVHGDSTLFMKGYGYRDQAAKLPMTAQTLFPIASTTKAINATLLGMLVDAGQLAWDAPVQNYLPHFRIGDTAVSAQVTLRDLVTMRTGLPRHDWVWLDHPTDRADLVRRMRYLELSSGFRERYQYNNLTVTAAGYVAEVVTGQSWELLAKETILDPLGMQRSGFGSDLAASTDDATLSYHETSDRKLVLSQRMHAEVTAPSGGALHSTVEDMARWVAFNLCGGKVQGRQLIEPQTLKEIHSPQIGVGGEFRGLMRGACYGMGWLIDTYNGSVRLTHGGYLHDVDSAVTLLPDHQIGIISFNNFGPSQISGLINEHAVDLMLGTKRAQPLEEKLSIYEKMVVEQRERNASVKRVPQTHPSHAASDYAGVYVHQGYGRLEIEVTDQELALRRHDLRLALEHWHYDVWVVRDTDLFAIHLPHPFRPPSRLMFESDAEGDITALSLQLEPTVTAIRFNKQVQPHDAHPYRRRPEWLHADRGQ